MTGRRDERLGAALRELEVPEHRPEFHTELRRRLSEVAEPRRPLLQRRRRVRWATRIAFAAAVLLLAVVALDVLREGDSGPGVGVEAATAAEIQGAVRGALADLKSLRGVLVAEGRGYESAYGWSGERRWRFVLTARGDFRLTGLTHEENLSYDAVRGVQRSYNPSQSAGGETLFAAVRTGIAPGPPDSFPAESLLQTDFGAFVRALLAADDPAVTEVEHEGRPAWRLDVEAQVNRIVPDFSGDAFSVWVDRETGLPVRVVETKGGRTIDELRLEQLEVNPELGPGALRVRFPEGVEVMRSDDGFRRTELAQVEEAVGYAPLVPARLPEGFQLAEVAVLEGTGLPTGVEGGNPPSTDVVSLSYRRGFDQVVVTTRLRDVPGFPGEWSDPLATGEGFVDEPELISLRRGALSGVEANVLVVPRNVPHLWALGERLVVTVAGDLGRAELVQVAESLRRHG